MRWILGVVLALLFTAPAQAGIVQNVTDFQSGTNGIALGPDGKYWVAEQYNAGTVARMTPGGQVVDRFSVGAGPTSVIAGPNNTVWVAATDAKQLVWFDATSPTPTAHPVSTGGGFCGPVGLATDGTRVYFTLPCGGGGSRIGSVQSDGGGLTSIAVPAGSYDLAVAGGKLFAPEPGAGEIRRYSLAANPAFEAAINAPNGPDAIAVDGGGTAWVTQHNGTVARFAITQGPGSSVTELPTAAGTLGDNPSGILIGADGNVWATGQTTNNIARITPSGVYTFFAIGGEPWKIVNGPDGDFFITDQLIGRVRRFVSTAPRVGAAAVGASSATATVNTTVDGRGNQTEVAFEYGPTTAYGATVAGAAVPDTSFGAVGVSVTLPGLSPATTYHVRVRASNAEGTTYGPDTTFSTAAVDADHDGVSPPLDCNDANPAIRPGAVDKPGDKIDQDCDGKDAAFPVLAARANFSWGFSGSRTALTKITVTGLVGGETIKITCKTKKKGCPFSSKTYKKVKKGKKSLTSLLGRKRLLKTGAKVEVRVTAAGAVGSSATATIGKRKRDPKIVRKRINP